VIESIFPGKQLHEIELADMGNLLEDGNAEPLTIAARKVRSSHSDAPNSVAPNGSYGSRLAIAWPIETDQPFPVWQNARDSGGGSPPL
jgi:hypothetical protein